MSNELENLNHFKFMIQQKGSQFTSTNFSFKLYLKKREPCLYDEIKKKNRETFDFQRNAVQGRRSRRRRGRSPSRPKYQN